MRKRAQQFHRLSRASRGGFTLIEMCLSMLVTSLVFGALAAFSMALSNLWAYSDDVQRAVLAANQTTMRIKDTFQGTKGTGFYDTGAQSGAAVLVLWAKDGDATRSVVADGKIQKSETQVIKFNETNKTLELYTSPVPSGADPDITAIINDATVPAYLMSGVSPKILARNVSNGRIMVMNPRSTTSTPELVFQFVTTSGTRSVRQDGTSTMQTPGVLP